MSSTEIETYDLVRAYESFLSQAFQPLASYDVSFSITKKPEIAAEKRRIKVGRKGAKKIDLKDQGKTLEETYERFRSLRGFFVWLHGKGLLSANMVRSTQDLPALFACMPVWYIEEREKTKERVKKEYRHPNAPLLRFCQIVGSDTFTWALQMFNLSHREFEDHKGGGDIIPMPLAELVREGRKAFDRMVLMTSDHGLATGLFGDPEWPRGSGTYLVGFLDALPSTMIVLGTWSNMPTLPEEEAMIDATMSYLSRRKNILPSIRSRRWFSGDQEKIVSTDHAPVRYLSKGRALAGFTQRMEASHRDGRLIDFLHGNYTPLEGSLPQPTLSPAYSPGLGGLVQRAKQALQLVFNGSERTVEPVVLPPVDQPKQLPAPGPTAENNEQSTKP
ncbi:MAG: hypothetical protein HQL50_13695 [Magnetococcales bacterium]|nr:hypothetical protein [Magnetococcales bacterium]